jgi:hypothetical protein
MQQQLEYFSSTPYMYNEDSNLLAPNICETWYRVNTNKPETKKGTQLYMRKQQVYDTHIIKE